MTRALSPTRPPDRWLTVVDGTRLRQLRHRHGLASAELAGQARIGMPTLARLDQPHQSCRTRTLARLAAALGQSSAALTVDPSPGHAAR